MADFPEQYRLTDDIMNKAYYSAKPEFRASLKNAVSLSYHYFGHDSSITDIKKISKNLNLFQNVASRPARHSILFFDAGYRASGRLCCAALMPILAGALPPLAICLDGEPHYDLLVALETAGVEDIFCMSSKNAAEFLNLFSHENSPEDLIPVFLNGQSASTLVNTARDLKLKFYEEKHLPKIAFILPDKLKNVHDPEKMLVNIEAAQGVRPEIIIYNEEEPDIIDKYYDCIYTPDYKMSLEHFKNCRLLLGSGCEAFWIFPDYSPGFFCKHRLALGFINNESEELS